MAIILSKSTLKAIYFYLTLAFLAATRNNENHENLLKSNCDELVLNWCFLHNEGMHNVNGKLLNIFFRPYVQNLLPCIVKIARRFDDLVQETLGYFMMKITVVLGKFMLEADVKVAVIVFLSWNSF